MDTKACSLTEDEIEQLIYHHGDNLMIDREDRIERINYLNRRLKAFKEEATKEQPKVQMTDAQADAINAAAAANPVKDGW